MWIAKDFQDLDLSGCSSLEKLPPIVNATSIWNISDDGNSYSVGFSSSIGNVANLKRLNLSRCSSLTWLPSSIVNLDNLYELDLSGCSNLMEFISSIGDVTKIKGLKVIGCSSLKTLRFSIRNLNNLQELDPSGCSNLMESNSSIEDAAKRLTGTEFLSLLEFPFENVTSLIDWVERRKLVFPSERRKLEFPSETVTEWVKCIRRRREEEELDLAFLSLSYMQFF